MNIKLIIFDLDGVLVDSRPFHYESLNLALSELDPKYQISHEEHLSIYDGLTTNAKLKLLTKNKSLSPDFYSQIWKRKQEHTINLIGKLESDDRLISIFKELKNRGYLLFVASNSIWNTIKMTLLRKGILEFVDYFISNQEVKEPKPSPEIYLRAVIRSGYSPLETLILEDSPIGRKAAIASGCHLLEIINPNFVTLSRILNKIKEINILDDPMSQSLPWLGQLNILIPMVGQGSRFEIAGYSFPKPLIDVNGKSMIETVLTNLNIKNAHYIFIVRKEHYEKYNLESFLNSISENCKIIISDVLTQGAACSCLLAKEYINNDIPLIIANSDQFVEWDVNKFMNQMKNVDAGIASFEDSHPKWSYAKVGLDGFVSEVAEKKVISRNATVGIYYWSKGKDFVKSAEDMIKDNFRVNNEFYVCPTFNYLIKDNKKVRLFEVDRMWGLGTPEDLDYFLKNYKK